MNIKEQFITKNDCYKAGRKITPKGIMVHSTATPGVLAEGWYSRWNKSGIEVAVHAFVDDSVICQHLPWNHRAWHCGASGNNTHISFEMCEPKDWKTNKTYAKKCYDNAVELATYLCKKYGLKSSAIVSHKEGHMKGIASNHGDPDHWWKYFGFTMNGFRKDVESKLNSTNQEAKPVANAATKANKVFEWQKAAIADGYKFPKYGADGCWGAESESVAKNAICKKQIVGYKNKNLTKIVQKAVGVEADGLYGNGTKKAVKAYQTKQKLSADGIVGLNTWKKILNV